MAEYSFILNKNYLFVSNCENESDYHIRYDDIAGLSVYYDNGKNPGIPDDTPGWKCAIGLVSSGRFVTICQFKTKSEVVKFIEPLLKKIN